MSATLHLNQLVQDRPRAGWPARLRVRVRRPALDRRLAAGADPWSDPELSIRAEELTDAETRVRIAKAIDRAIVEAGDPPPPMTSQVPLARPAIRACTPRLRAISGRLKGDHMVTPRGMAQAAMLVREGASPLYMASTSETALRHRLAGIADALG
jgi:hypothetical protein